jgi:hypothetical protein
MDRRRSNAVFLAIIAIVPLVICSGATALIAPAFSLFVLITILILYGAVACSWAVSWIILSSSRPKQDEETSND